MRTILRSIWNEWIWWSWALCLLGVSCTTVPVQPPSMRSLVALQNFADSKRRVTLPPNNGLPEAQVGYFLLDPKTQEVVSHNRENEFFIPGSVSKIPTTLAALQILGPNYRFKTYLAYQGRIQGSRLIGDLYLKGTGDPALKIAHLMEFAEKLQKTGIREVQGHFYYDESEFIPQEVIEQNRESWAGFNSSVSALSHEFNQFMTYWRPTADPTVSAIFSVPSASWIQFSLGDHFPTTQTFFRYQNSKNNDSFKNFIDRNKIAQNVDQWVLSRDAGSEGVVRLPVKKAALTTASVFAELCQMHRIRLPEPQAGRLAQRGHSIAIHNSPLLIDLVESILEYSNNLMAELVNLAAARKLVHRPVSVSDAASVIQNWFRKKEFWQNEVQHQTHSFVNASGLSSENQMSPRQLASYLLLADQMGTGTSRSFENLLAISGKKGSLESRLIEPGLAFHVWAKTGSMDFTNAIGGYLYTSQGRRLIFAIMATDRTERAAIEEFNEPAPQAILDRARTWAQQAKHIQDQIIIKWIKTY